MTDVHLRDKLREQLSTNRVPQAEPARAAAARPPALLRASDEDVAAFLRQLALLVTSEFPVSRALQVLSRSRAHPDLQRVIAALAESTAQGIPLDASMSKYPWYFDDACVAVVRAAERGGSLGQSLTYLADQRDRDREMADEVGNALAYPVFLLLFAAVVLVALLVFVVPQFTSGLATNDAPMHFTGAAAAVVAASAFARTPWGIPLLVGGVTFVGLLVSRWRRTNPRAFDRAVGRIPVIGSLVLHAALARFCEGMFMLTSNSVGVLDAIGLVRDGVGHAYVRDAVDAMATSVRSGKGMVEPLANYPRLPPIFVDMLAVAEESGNVTTVMGHLSRYTRAHLSRLTRRFSILIQPVMLILIGAMVVGIVLTMFLPYLETLMNLSYAGTRAR